MPDEVKRLDERRRALFTRGGHAGAAADEGAARGAGAVAARRRDSRRRRSARRSWRASSTRSRRVTMRRGTWWCAQELDRLMPLDAKATRLSAQIEREPMLAREQAQLRDHDGARSTRGCTALRARRDSVTVPEEEFTAVRAEFERASAEMRAVELTVVQAESDAQNAARGARGGGAERARSRRPPAAARRSQHARSGSTTSWIARTPTCAPTSTSSCGPSCRSSRARSSRDLTDGRYGELELDDNYDIKVLEDGVPKPVISGGEEDLANLVLRLAISQMIAERAGQPFALLVLDEIFGSLDELHRASVIDLLRRLQDRFEQVILITHIESVRDMLDHVITVRFDEETAASVGDAAGCRAAGDRGADGRAERPRRSSRARRWRTDGRHAHRPAAAPRGAAPRAGRRMPRRSTRCSATRSPSATAATGSWACACRSSIRRSGVSRSRTPTAARCSGATTAGRSPRSTWRTRRAWKDGWARSPCAPISRRGGLGKAVVTAGERLARARGVQHDRPRDDAAHDGQHRLLLGARLSCPASSR